MADDDDTIRLTPPRPAIQPAVASPRPARSRVWIAAFAVVVIAAGGAAFAFFGHGTTFAPSAAPVLALAPAPSTAPSVAPPAAPARIPQPPEFALRDATEAQINANTEPVMTVFRFLPNPHILVLDFPDLHQQAMMLNRVAALVEKSGLPRDRVLNDAELAAAIHAGGDTPETYYYGHDYSAASLTRFFALAERDHVALTPEEGMLHRLLDQVGDLQPNATGAVISIPHAGLDPLIDSQARATILHHELSHGEYFTNPTYADYSRQFFRSDMTAEQRAAFVAFLGSEEYDTGDADLMMNETQAYLMHTPDPRFFRAVAVKMSDPALTQLRTSFLLGMPRGWLRDCTSVPLAP